MKHNVSTGGAHFYQVLSHLESWVVKLLNQMFDVDVAGLQPHEELLALRPGDELHVERVAGQEGDDSRR